ncbi:multidrug resistance-associated protein 5 [Tanacetum coccineum]
MYKLLRNGWKACGRKIIALDDCFLKSPNQGEILTAIGRDVNNHIYLVAWAVGLIEAVKDVIPNAEHKQCARHIYENFRKQYPGLECRQLFWVASKASYPQVFNKIMDKINSANPNAHNECFNSVIVNVRHKPLLTMLEAIRVIVLEKMNKIKEIGRKWNPRVCPNIKKRLEWLKEQQRFWHYTSGGNLYEVRSGSEGFTIDKGKRTCSCRMWQLSGLPCVHATKSTILGDLTAKGIASIATSSSSGMIFINCLSSAVSLSSSTFCFFVISYTSSVPALFSLPFTNSVLKSSNVFTLLKALSNIP